MATKKTQMAKKSSAQATPADKPVPLMRKPVKWVADTQEEVSAWSDEVKLTLGSELAKLQMGGFPSPGAATHVPEVGDAAYELRANDGGGWFRIFYVAKFSDAIYVLSAFQKQSNQLTDQDIALGHQRYKAALRQNIAAAQAATPAKTGASGKSAAKVKAPRKRGGKKEK